MHNLVDEVCEKLSRLSYKKESYSNSSRFFECSVIEPSRMPLVREAIYDSLIDIAIKNAELEAKLLVYESVVRNSNFAPMAPTDIEAQLADPSV